MTDLASDPIHNAVQKGIKEDITLAADHERWRAAVILIYAGMDTMAYLDMPAGKDDVTKGDFIRWADRYMRFPCVDQITGADFYGARCAMLHAYGAVSKMSRAGQCRMVSYVDKSIPEVLYEPTVSRDLVLVSASALKDAFFRAIDDFLIVAFSDSSKAAMIEQRLQHMTVRYDLRKDGP